MHAKRIRSLGGGALRRRGFRLLLAGQATSYVGDRILSVALAFAVLDLTHSAADVGYVLAARTVPLVATSLVGGVWADRFPARGILLVADAARAAAQAATAALVLTGSARVWQLLALQAAYGVATGAFNPAATVFLPQLVAPEELRSANAVLGLARSGANVVGPALAGVLVAAAGAGAAIAADAGTFAVSVASFAAIGPVGSVVRRDRTSLLRDLAEGWHEFASRSWVWISVTSFAVVNAVGFSAYYVLGPLVADRWLGGASAWGIVLTGTGVGGVVGGVVSLRIAVRRPLFLGFVAVATSFPLFLVLLALHANAFLLAGVMAYVEASLSFFGIAWTTSLQRFLPEQALGRVSAYDWLASIALQPVGMALVGPVAAAAGLGTTLVAAAVVVAAMLGGAAASHGVRALAEPAPRDAVAAPAL